ncbi:hypothetical protein HOP62_03105 [Halomonas sp. MCCC 1A17488]|uniref:Uncharacterized protein n=1 Tax=Billgrantia sulfidoxydans TaxID=2733484 RepID=A0ABX7W5K5_9GAMM|nr:MULTISPECIES: hypothetical protein [Halomonas]MCE8015061.1 hypothetical protein [Halomonas sp. MCCC 1A17488]MCG3238394.1 hypothetical protein [Halomonas sp. MCCC 1A17488]QPP47863.1 hypothetical protein I4484_11295 [Halomonas sp. SS10-MC5]QTP55166.1 hypothetical protein HNO51_11000 [Halomonas sulfidoxydans]
MVLSGDALTTRASAIGFFVLFPGFILYHTLVAMGVIPAVLGGLFGVVSVLMFIVYCALLPSQLYLLLTASRGYALVTLCFFVYVLLWSAVNYGLIGGSVMQAALIQTVETLVLWLVLFVLGYRIPLDSPRLARAFWIAFVLIAGYLAFHVATTGQWMFFARRMLEVEAEAGDSVSTYQGYARSALVLLLFLIAVSERAVVRAVLIVLGAFVMFVLGARSELYAFLALSGLLLLLWAGMSVKYMLTLLAVVGVLMALVVSQFEALAGSRQLQIFDLSGTSSWLARQNLGQRAVAQILESPLLGRFGGHIASAQVTGGYAHSMLSAWVNYGLLGFALYLGLTLFAFVGAAYRLILLGDRGGRWVFAFSVNFVCLLLMVLAKPVFWPLPALGWGAFANALVASRRERDADDMGYAGTLGRHDDEPGQHDAARDLQGRNDNESGTPDLRPSAL